ncbi:MAG: substrate-binding domain-containing protein [Oscillospiraceae bacterium]|nr:substrate-binding domain-containing protein [Oscillospiraceae bacterium]
MKKFLALILALAMVLSLVACGEKAPVDEGTPDDGAAVTEGFVWNGNKEVWAVLPVSGVPGLSWNTDFAGYFMEKQGWTYVSKDAQGDPSNQVSLIEDAIAAGNVGALIVPAMVAPMLQDVCARAYDAGIAIAFLGAKADYPIAGCVYTLYSVAGVYAVKAAEDWVQKRVAEGGNVPTNADGKYEVAVDTYYDIEDGIFKSNAFVCTVDESDILVGVSNTTSYGNSPVTTAYDNASAVLAANPDCRIFIAYEPDEAMGIESYIRDYAEQNGLDLADFCVISGYAEDATFRGMWAEAQADPSSTAIKGYATFGGKCNEEELAECIEVSGEATWAACYATGRSLATILLGSCGGFEGYTWNYGDIYWDDVDATNIYGFTLGYKNGDVNVGEKYQTEERMGSF